MIDHKFESRLLKSGNTRCDLPIPTELVYDPDTDPLTVRMVFETTEDGDVVWMVGLDLLVDGASSFDQVVGLGDVRLRARDGYWPFGMLTVCLRTELSHADLGMPLDEVGEFLARAQAVRADTDDCLTSLVDQAIEEILGS